VDPWLGKLVLSMMTMSSLSSWVFAWRHSYRDRDERERAPIRQGSWTRSTKHTGAEVHLAPLFEKQESNLIGKSTQREMEVLEGVEHQHTESWCSSSIAHFVDGTQSVLLAVGEVTQHLHESPQNTVIHTSVVSRPVRGVHFVPLTDWQNVQVPNNLGRWETGSEREFTSTRVCVSNWEHSE
jgi:hypothetical protein